MVDLSKDEARQVVIAKGTEEIYQGHPTTVLLPDGKTMYAVWTLGHGGHCGPMKRSEDGGRTWSELLRVPENWKETKNCPALYRLADPQGVARLFVFAGQGPDGNMHSAWSEDEGKNWTPMKSVGLECVMPFCTIMPVDGGKRLIGLTNIRRPGEVKDKRSNVVVQGESRDGGLTWGPWRVLVDLGQLKPCEPEVIRSPDGKQLLCLIRENVRSQPAHYITSDDEGHTWTQVKDLPFGLHGDRHKAVYTAGGRLVVCFRDMGAGSATRGHFVAWVGKYEDIVAGRDGAYKVKLLHNYAGTDCGYPGVELLADGTVVATTYLKYRPGAEKHSVVSVRFTLAETDKAEKVRPAKEPEAKVAGILLDDDKAKYVGPWVESGRQQPLAGAVYRHDGNAANKGMMATFTPNVPEAGPYEVRLLYVATSNRATNVPVTVRSKDGDKTLTVNQREECLEDGVPRALGVFNFDAGKKGGVTVANLGADGYVVVDGLQLVPEAIAQAERATRSGAGFPTGGKPSKTASERQEIEEKRKALAAAVAFSPLTKEVPNRETPKPDTEPVFLAKDAQAKDVDGKSYDLVVVGGTAGGVACAVRAAREGCTVLLVQHNRHIGGMLSNGLMQWDALYGGPRAPLFSELLKNIEKHYIDTFGKDSKNHQIVRCTHEHYPISWVEPHVMERECHRLVAGEKNITLLLEHYPVAVERDGALLKGAKLRAYGTLKDIQVKAAMFADGTYEGDLFALAKVPYRAGREAREEYHEPHAGKVFVNIDHSGPRSVVDQGLNIRVYNSRQGSVDPTSPFTADDAVQAYNYRFCVTRDPANRIMLTEPPPGYNREEYVNYERKAIATGAGPNLKSHMNSPILPGENHGYPEGTWEQREKIVERHKNFGLGLIWFLQNDESVPEKKREEFRQWGLPKDEFADNGHVPYEMYVREARRIVGRHVITERDNMLAKTYARTPVHSDSVAITDWYMDSHSCTLNARPGYRYDGKLILTEESRPAQIPYRSLLPQGVDNLLVPVCLSSTHIAWGAIRLEPVWMQTGEAAGFAAALAKNRQVAPAKLDPEVLVRTLVERRQMVSFFNDMKVNAKDPRIPAAQYFATKGFFTDYDARLDAPLKKITAAVWVIALKELKTGKLRVDKVTEAVAKAEADDSPAMAEEMWTGLLMKAGLAKGMVSLRGGLTRGEALRQLYELRW